MLETHEILNQQQKNNRNKAHGKYRHEINVAFSRADVVRRALKEEQRKNAELTKQYGAQMSKKQQKKMDKKHKKGGGNYDVDFDMDW